jgi:hypothetical protein
VDCRGVLSGRATSPGAQRAILCPRCVPEVHDAATQSHRHPRESCSQQSSPVVTYCTPSEHWVALHTVAEQVASGRLGLIKVKRGAPTAGRRVSSLRCGPVAWQGRTSDMNHSAKTRPVSKSADPPGPPTSRRRYAPRASSLPRAAPRGDNVEAQAVSLAKSWGASPDAEVSRRVRMSADGGLSRGAVLAVLVVVSCLAVACTARPQSEAALRLVLRRRRPRRRRLPAGRLTTRS